VLLLVGACGAGMATYRGHLAPTPSQIAKALHDHLDFFDGKKVVIIGVVDTIAHKGESPPAIPMLVKRPPPYDANYVIVTVGKSSAGVPVRVTAQDPPNIKFQVGENVTVWGTGKSAFASNVYDNVTLVDAVVEKGEAPLPWASSGGASATNASGSPTAASTPTPGSLVREATGYFSKALVHEDKAWKAAGGASFVKQFDGGVRDYNIAVKLMPYDDNSKQHTMAVAFGLCVRNTIRNTRAFAKAFVNRNEAASSRFAQRAAGWAVKAHLALTAYTEYTKSIKG
jgi:hypothetical protein